MRIGHTCGSPGKFIVDAFLIWSTRCWKLLMTFSRLLTQRTDPLTEANKGSGRLNSQTIRPAGTLTVDSLWLFFFFSWWRNFQLCRRTVASVWMDFSGGTETWKRWRIHLAGEWRSLHLHPRSGGVCEERFFWSCWHGTWQKWTLTVL